jgi:hypothetical protein
MPATPNPQQEEVLASGTMAELANNMTKNLTCDGPIRLYVPYR